VNTEADLKTALELLAVAPSAVAQPEPNRCDVRLEPGDLVAAAAKLQAAHWGYLSAITGLDHGPASGELEALYHFCHGAAVLTLRVRLPRQGAALPSLCDLTAIAGPLERELSEMFGININGSPDRNRLYLPDEWPPELYPLRKDAPLADLEKDPKGLAN